MKSHCGDYFNKELVVNELSAFQTALADSSLSANAIPSDALANELIGLVDHMLLSRNFFGYTNDVKDDMRSNALVVLVKAIPKFDLNRADKVFSYFTRCTYLSFLTTIMKYYKRKNLQRKLYAEQLQKLGASSDEIDAIIAANNGVGVQSNNPFNKGYRRKI